MARPEIKNIADLKGKSVGVTRFGAAADFGMRMFLKKYGLEPVKDVPLVQIGRHAGDYHGAFEENDLMPRRMSQPMAYVVQQAGLKMIRQSRQGGNSLHAFGVSNDKKIHQGTIARKQRVYLRAYGKSIQFMYTHKEETQRDLCPLH